MFASLKALILPVIAPGRFLPVAPAPAEGSEDFAAMMAVMGDGVPTTPVGGAASMVPATAPNGESPPSIMSSTEDMAAPPAQAPRPDPIAVPGRPGAVPPPGRQTVPTTGAVPVPGIAVPVPAASPPLVGVEPAGAPPIAHPDPAPHVRTAPPTSPATVGLDESPVPPAGDAPRTAPFVQAGDMPDPAVSPAASAENPGLTVPPMSAPAPRAPADPANRAPGPSSPKDDMMDAHVAVSVAPAVRPDSTTTAAWDGEPSASRVADRAPLPVRPAGVLAAMDEAAHPVPTVPARIVPAPDVVPFPLPAADPASLHTAAPVAPQPDQPARQQVEQDRSVLRTLVATKPGAPDAVAEDVAAHARPETVEADKPHAVRTDDAPAGQAMPVAPPVISTQMPIEPERAVSHDMLPGSPSHPAAITPPQAGRAYAISNILPVGPMDDAGGSDSARTVAPPPSPTNSPIPQTVAGVAIPAGNHVTMVAHRTGGSAELADVAPTARDSLATPDDRTSAEPPSLPGIAPAPAEAGATTASVKAGAMAGPMDDAATAASPTVSPSPPSPPATPAAPAPTAALPRTGEDGSGKKDMGGDPPAVTPSLAALVQQAAADKPTVAPLQSTSPLPHSEPVAMRAEVVLDVVPPVMPMRGAVDRAASRPEPIGPSASQAPAASPVDRPALASAAPVGAITPPLSIEPAPAVKSEALSLLQLVRDQFARRKPVDAQPAAAPTESTNPASDMLTPAPAPAHALATAPPATAPTIMTAPSVPVAALPQPVNDIGGALANQAVNMGVRGQWIDGLAREIASLSANGGQGSFQIHADQLGPVQVAIRQGPQGADISLIVTSEAAEQALRQDGDRLRSDAALSAVRVADLRIERAPAAGDTARNDGGQQSPSQQGGSTGGGASQGTGQAMGQGMGQGRSQSQENLAASHKASVEAAVLNHVDARDGAAGGASASGHARYA